MNGLKGIYDTKEAAKYLHLSPATLESWRCRGGGPVYRKYNRAVRYLQADLDDFLTRCGRRSTSDEGIG